MAGRDAKPPINEVQKLYINDFSGGLNSTISGSLLNKQEAQVAKNISFEQKGTLKPRKGRRKRYAAPFVNKAVTGLGAYYKSDGTSRLVIATGDQLYYDKPHLATKWTEKADWDKDGVVKSNLLSTSNVEGSLVVQAGNRKLITSATYGTKTGTVSNSYGYSIKPKQNVTMRGFRIYNPSNITNYNFHMWLALDKSQKLNIVEFITGEPTGWVDVFCEPTLLIKDEEYRFAVSCASPTFYTPMPTKVVDSTFIDVLLGYSSDAINKYIETALATLPAIDLLFDESVYTTVLTNTNKAEGTSTNLEETTFKIAVEFPSSIKVDTTQADFSGIKTNVSTSEVVDSVVLSRQGV